MKGIRKLVLVAVPLMLGAVAGISPAFAQSTSADSEDEDIAGAPAEAAAASQGRHDPIASAQERLAHLKSKLGITAEQEPQWSAFSDAVMQRVAQLKRALRREAHCSDSTAAHRPPAGLDEGADRCVRGDRRDREGPLCNA